MIIRIAFFVAATIVLSASSAHAQGRPTQQLVVSEAVMKSMIANKPKPKVKIPLTARLKMSRSSSGGEIKPSQAAPTSVREISPASKKK